MTALVRALSAETLKLKRTLAVWLTLLAPLAVVFLSIAIMLESPQYAYSQKDVAWVNLIERNLSLWALLMLPLFVTLEMALLGQLEHGPRMFKQTYALPIPRWAVYAAKQIAGLAVIALSMIALGVMTLAAGLLMRVLLPGAGFEVGVPWVALGQDILLAYLGGWLIISIHTFVSLRWPSFVVACSTGIVATIMGVMLISSKYAPFYPWTLPALVSINAANGDPFLEPLLVALIGSVVVAVFGGWEVTRRDAA